MLCISIETASIMNNNILNSDYLDIIFNGRNKAYGGYELRKNYQKRTRRAAVAALSLFLLSASVPVIAGRLVKNNDSKIVKMETPINLAQPPILPAKKVPQPPAPTVKAKVRPPAIKNTDYVVSPDHDVTERPPTQAEINNHVSGPATTVGDPTGLEGDIIDRPNATGKVIEENPMPAKPFTYVDQMPYYEGGAQQYVADHANFSQAKEANVDGKVLVTFVVNEDGSISDIQITRDFGYGSAEEVKRVLSHMGKWVPGKMNGHPVKVYFKLPIKFVLD